MKCENCGKEQVNYHFTSNINGNITEKHLCSECAAQLGYPTKSVADSESSFEEIFTDLFGMTPPRRMMNGYGIVFPTYVIPTVAFVAPPDSTPADTAPAPSAEQETDATIKQDENAVVDEQMKQRRELNILREQLRQAVESEAYEKAAELRDQIKQLEADKSL